MNLDNGGRKEGFELSDKIVRGGSGDRGEGEDGEFEGVKRRVVRIVARNGAVRGSGCVGVGSRTGGSSVGGDIRSRSRGSISGSSGSRGDSGGGGSSGSSGSGSRSGGVGRGGRGGRGGGVRGSSKGISGRSSASLTTIPTSSSP